jgi:hypothetical protein
MNHLDFDLGSMQYMITSENFGLPSAGLKRKYTTSEVSPDNKYIFLGTTGGEICLFDIKNKIFKALLPVNFSYLNKMIDI